MMTKTWNFDTTKKIADGVNKLLSFFCLVLIWCACMIFSKISLVTSHRAFSTRFDFTAGNTPCRKSTNQRRAFTLFPVSWFSVQRKSKTTGWSVRKLFHYRTNAKINYRHIHKSHYMIPISNTELAGTQRNMEKGTVNDITTFREMTATS